MLPIAIRGIKVGDFLVLGDQVQEIIEVNGQKVTVRTAKGLEYFTSIGRLRHSGKIIPKEEASELLKILYK